MVPKPTFPPLLNLYQDETGKHDEMWGPDGPYLHWKEPLKRLDSLGAEELGKRKTELQRLLRENGVTYTIYNEDKSNIRPWKLDPIPFVLSPETWKELQEGLEQRAQVLNLLLQDLYGSGKILLSGTIPPELIYSDPAYLLACRQDTHPLPIQLSLYAADISKGPDGRLWVIGDRTQAPSGWGYALENRISMTKALPELFQASHIQKITDFYDDLAKSFRFLSPTLKENPLIVILTPGPFNETYFEHAYLAALQGFTLVQGQDLMVKDRKVWLKTLGGLEQVDLIIRRVDDSYCDPLELYPDSQLGVPGLLEAVRLGSVKIVNSLGSGILENPGLMAFLPSICQYYLGEPLKLPSLASWWCGHHDEKAYTLEHLDKLVIKHIDRRKKNRTHFGWLMSKKELAILRNAINQNPFLYVGQEQAIYSTAPAFDGTKLVPRKTALRCFLQSHQDGYTLMPGGLTRSAPGPGNIYVSNQAGGISKDTWVLSTETPPQKPIGISFAEPDMLHAGFKPLDEIPSRAAENLFWIGRYTTRAIHTARLLQSVLRFQAERKNFEQLRDSEALDTLLKAFTHFTLTYPGFVEDDSLLDNPDPELHAMVVETQRVGTLGFTLNRWVQAVQSERDRWANSSQIILENVERGLSQYQQAEQFNARNMRTFLDLVINGIASFHGLNTDSMAGHDGRILYDLGRYLEQASLVCQLFRSTLTVKREALVEESLMKVVLTSSGCLPAFRYRYRSYLNLPAVLSLLLLDKQFPRSVAYTLEQIHNLLESLPGRNPNRLISPEQKLALDSFTQVRLTSVETLIHLESESWIRENLDQLLARLGSNLAQCAELIIRKYFSHTSSLIHPETPPIEG